MQRVDWKIGVEIELLAPRGKTRADLAAALARAVKGRVVRGFHPDAEASHFEGQLFYNLTPAFEVRRGKTRLFRLIDDVTIRHDMLHTSTPKPGWYRIVSDDARLIYFGERHCDGSASASRVLEPVQKLFGGTITNSNGMNRLANQLGQPILMTAPLPGERERVCELVTHPMERDHEKTLSTALAIARKLRFQIPHEGATHLHFDASPLQSPLALRNLMLALHPRRLLLRALFHTNPACIRLGPWPEPALHLVSRPAFCKLSWAEARERLIACKPIKYCDVNVVNLLKQTPDKNTVEFRMFPVHLTPEPIIDAAVIFEHLLKWACTAKPLSGLENERAVNAASAREFFHLIGAPGDVAQRLLRASSLG